MSTILEILRPFLRSRREQTYLVGGTVRDLLLGRAIRDADVAVQGNAAKLAREFADKIGAAFYVMDETFDVARVIWENEGAREVADFARLRGDSVAEDLRTRDFTVNAMAADAVNWNGDAALVIDPLNGLADLYAKRLRVVSHEVFRDDAVRLVRAVRLDGELGFASDDATIALARRDAALIEHAPMERVRDELVRILGSDNVLRQLRQLDALDLLGYILPELNAMRGVAQSSPHIYNVFDHSLAAVAAAGETEGARYANSALSAFRQELTAHFAQTTAGTRTRREILRLTLLLHDLGKPATRTVDGSGRIRFFGHDDKGVELVEPALRRLKISNDEIDLVETVIRNHLRPILLAQNGMSDRALYRFFRNTGTAGVDVVVHAWCDQLATYGDSMPPDVAGAMESVTGRMLDAYFHAHEHVVSPRALLNGDDVMAHLQIPPGPQVRVLLEAVREAQALGQITTRAEALKFLETHQGDYQKP